MDYRVPLAEDRLGKLRAVRLRARTHHALFFDDGHANHVRPAKTFRSWSDMILMSFLPRHVFFGDPLNTQARPKVQQPQTSPWAWTAGPFAKIWQVRQQSVGAISGLL